MSRILVPYDNFGGGDYGRAGPYNAPANTFDALNMYVTRAGELTVRGGLRNVTPTGVSASAATYLGEFAANQSDGFPNYVFYVDSAGTPNFKFFSPMDIASLSGATGLGAGGTLNDHYAVPGTTYFVKATGATNGTAAHVPSAFGGSQPGTAVALYLNRLVIATTSGGPQLRWSDIDATTGAPNFNSWTSTNVASVGSADTNIIAIRPQRSHLVVFKPEGIFVVTGDMATATVRQVSTTFGPLNQAAVKLTRNETIWYIPGLSGTPWMFDGAHAREMSRYPLGIPGYQNGAGAPTTALGGLPTEDQGVFILSNDISDNLSSSLGWLYLNGVWTKHTLPFQLQPFVAPITASVLTDPGLAASINETFWRSVREVSSLVFVDTSTTPKFYSMTLSERPGTETTPPFAPALLMPEKAGDDSTAQVSGSVTFPEWHSPAGEDAMVRVVTVDFRAWNTGGSLTNHFDLTATALRLYNSDGTLASQTQSYDEAGSLAATGGTLQRRVFSFGDQGLGNGFQISLTNVRGVSIRRIQVVVETSPFRAAS